MTVRFIPGERQRQPGRVGVGMHCTTRLAPGSLGGSRHHSAQVPCPTRVCVSFLTTSFHKTPPIFPDASAFGGRDGLRRENGSWENGAKHECLYFARAPLGPLNAPFLLVVLL